MRIIGIDPGMAIVGYCILDIESGNTDCEYTLISSGSIQTDKSLSDSARLLEIHNDIKELVNIFEPDVAAIEQLFFFKNAKTVMPVSQARGVILLSFEMLNVPVFEYTPLVVKQTITGYGRAEKEDVKEMVCVMLKDQKVPKLDDTTDAIAIALCHACYNK